MWKIQLFKNSTNKFDKGRQDCDINQWKVFFRYEFFHKTTIICFNLFYYIRTFWCNRCCIYSGKPKYSNLHTKLLIYSIIMSNIWPWKLSILFIKLSAWRTFARVIWDSRLNFLVGFCVCARGGKNSIRLSPGTDPSRTASSLKTIIFPCPKSPLGLAHACKNARRSPSHTHGAAAGGRQTLSPTDCWRRAPNAGSKAHLCMCGYHTVTP